MSAMSKQRKRRGPWASLGKSLRSSRKARSGLEQTRRALSNEIRKRERVEAELLHSAGRLAKSERLFSLLARNASDVIFIIDADHVCIYISPAITALTGHSPETIIGSSIGVLVQERWLPLLEGARKRRDQEETDGKRDSSPVRWELELVRTDGSLVWTDTIISPLRGEDGALEGFLGVARNIASRKRAEAALEVAHRQMSGIISAITAILLLVDGVGRVTHVNDAARAAFGLIGAAVQGRFLGELPLGLGGQELDALLSEIRRCRKSGETRRLDDLHYFRKDQSEGLLGLTLYPMEEGGVLILGRDISEARIKEQRQAHEQKMQSIGRLAAGIAHEINTPVQYLGFNAGFLENAFKDVSALIAAYRKLHGLVLENSVPPAMATLSDHIKTLETEADIDYLLQEAPLAIANSRQGVEQIGRIVQAMHQLSHPGRLARSEMGVVDINAMVANAVVVTRNEWKRHAKVEQQLDPTLPDIPGWGAELGQVVINLLLNAAQAIEESRTGNPEKRDVSGRIVVRTRWIPDATEGAQCEIMVADSGSGVPEDLRARIFEPFFTTKDVGQGTGQGLAIAHAIVVEQHGGRITVEDAPGGGALFRLYLPATLEDAAGNASR